MRCIKTLLLIPAFGILAGLGASAQTRSEKRGLGWDEKTQTLTDTPLEALKPGISWIYNWGATPGGNASILGAADGLGFAPMCWNAGFNEGALRSYLTAHPSTKYLLGFNEPNFSAQSNMTPQYAASQWPRLEQIAADYGLTLVAPALNFTGEKVGGRTWSPYEWLDEFVKQYKASFGKLPRIDCLALHCYMNWYGASTWFTTEYFYKDLYDAKNENYGRFPNIVELLDAGKAASGHFPRMMLTEFCSWEGDKDGFKTTPENQIDQMTQKVQKMEQSDLVEGYAWFMANGNAASFPYYSIYKTNSPQSELSDLGKVYVHMSSFDTEKHYAPAERVMAKDYVDASTDDQQVRLRPNCDATSDVPLKVVFGQGAWAAYQIEVPEAGEYEFSVSIKSAGTAPLWLYVDKKVVAKASLDGTADAWQERSFTAKLAAGKHSVMLYNAGTATFAIHSWNFASKNTGIADAPTADADAPAAAYDLQGKRIAAGANLPAGIYIFVDKEGKRVKRIVR